MAISYLKWSTKFHHSICVYFLWKKAWSYFKMNLKDFIDKEEQKRINWTNSSQLQSKWFFVLVSPSFSVSESHKNILFLTMLYLSWPSVSILYHRFPFSPFFSSIRWWKGCVHDEWQWRSLDDAETTALDKSKAWHSAAYFTFIDLCS